MMSEKEVRVAFAFLLFLFRDISCLLRHFSLRFLFKLFLAVLHLFRSHCLCGPFASRLVHIASLCGSYVCLCGWVFASLCCRVCFVCHCGSFVPRCKEFYIFSLALLPIIFALV